MSTATERIIVESIETAELSEEQTRKDALGRQSWDSLEELLEAWSEL